MYGRCKTLDSLKSFLWYASQLSWRRKWQPTPVSLPGKSHGQWSLVGCSPWSYKELGTTEWLTHFSYLGPVSCVFTFWAFLGLIIGSGCSLMAAKWQLLSFLSSLRTHRLTLGDVVADDYDMLVFTGIIFHFPWGKGHLEVESSPVWLGEGEGVCTHTP